MRKANKLNPPPSAAVKLSDVAREAGVSEITVSRVVRNSGAIAPQTRARVEAAIRKSGYVPNRVAGSLASAGSNLIGVVLPSLSNSVFPEVLNGLQSVLTPNGYRPVVSVTEYSPEAEYESISALLSWRPAALVVTGLEHLDETRRLMVASGAPVVEVMDIDGEAVDIAVGFSNKAAGRQAAKRLIDAGYRRIGYVGHNVERDLRAKKRREAFVKALARGGRPCVGEVVIAEPSSIDAGRRGLAKLLCAHPRLDAVYFSNDDMAIGGMFHCQASGVSVPRQLAIVGFNGLEIGQAMPQPLTTIRTPRHEIGAVAARRLLDRLAGRDAPLRTEVAFEFIAGATA